MAALTLLSLVSCNKDVETDKAITVAIHGYNIGDDQLEVSVDTAVYTDMLLRANEQIGFSAVYPYFAGKKDATLRVKNKETGKELFSQTMSLETGKLEFYYNLLHIDGKLVEVKEPAVDTSTNKLGFYIHYPTSNEPIDIILYNTNTGAMAYLAEKVMPGTMTYVDYLPQPGLTDKNVIEASLVYFTKAGTFDWAFNDNEYNSQSYGHGMYIPHRFYNLGKVQSYFMTPSPSGYGVDVARLFPNNKLY